eukprot:PhM_4_TR4942/c1_g1_i1/m.30336/K17541/SCYL2; SCY1-like protein 2
MFKDLKDKFKERIDASSSKHQHGNVIYSTADGPVASGGHLHLWRIYNGVDKTSGESVSVFILDKAEVEKTVNGDKKVAADVVSWYKHSASQQVKLHHPHVLRVIAPLSESSSRLILVTEQVFGSISNAIMKNYDGLTKGVSQAMKDFHLPAVEKQYGLYQLADALQFLHSHANVVHMNVTPACIYISKKGEWKIADFHFSVPASALQTKSLQWNQNFRCLTSEDITDTRVNPWLGPNMDYAAPEYVLRNDPSVAGDYFSYGCVAFDVLRAGTGRGLISAMSNITSYQCAVDAMHHRSDWCGLDHASQQTIISLTHRDLSQRIDLVKLVTAAPLFGDPLIRCLIYVTRMSAQDSKTKLPFLKTLYDSVTHYSPRIMKMKILPSLIQELSDERMLRFVLPIILLCVAPLDSADVEKIIIPAIGPLMLRTDLPVVVQLILEKLNDLIPKISNATQDKYVLPLLCSTLKLHVDARLVMPLLKHVVKLTEAQTISHAQFREHLLPLVLRLLANPGAPQDSKLAALGAIQDLLCAIDADTIRSSVEPALNAVITRERDTQPLMKLVDVYSAMAQRYGRELTVMVIVPSLCPLLLSTSLSYQQIHAVSQLLCALVNQVDSERQQQFDAEQRNLESARRRAESDKKEEESMKAATFDDYNPHAWQAPKVEARRLPEPVAQIPAPTAAMPPPVAASGGNGWADFADEPPVKMHSQQQQQQQ